MKKGWVILILMLLFITGCGKEQDVSNNTEKPYTVDPVDGDVIIVYEDGYEAEIISVLEEEIRINGMICRAEDMLAVDTSGNRILRLNYEGEIIETIGNTGNGAGEFLNPTEIAVYEDKLYILDAGNLRIQVMNQNFEVENIISLEGLGTYSIGELYDSLAVVNENMIFLTTSYDYKIYLIKNQKEMIVLEDNFCGTCTAENGKAYFAQSMILTDSMGNAVSGKVFYAEYDEKESLVKNQLPYHNTPLDIVISGEDMFVINGSYRAVERCDLNGDYNSTIYKFLKSINDRIMNFTELSMDENDNFYVYDRYNNEIQKVYKVQ